MNDNLAIGVMSSVNFKQRYTACQRTWLKDFDNTFIFGGHKADEVDSCLIPIENAGEDWESCFLKQQLGLKYMYEHNPNYDWYSISGCDNILFKEKLMSEFKQYNPNEDYFISQGCGIWDDVPFLRQTNQETETSFVAIAGGASFFVSNSLMKKIYPLILYFNDYWQEISGPHYGCADVGLSLMLKKYFNINVTENKFLFSQNDEFYLNQLNYTNFNVQTPISLHYIKPSEMNDKYEKYKFSSEKNLKNLCETHSDINEHLLTLKKYAQQCDSVTEMGTRFVVSTWAFIEAKPKKLRCYDLIYDYYKPSEFAVNKTCSEYGIDFQFICGDSLKVNIEDTDLLFIDTLHTHNQLLMELNRHSRNVKKWIILHDTTLFGYVDEVIFDNSSDIIKNEVKTGQGLISAINIFLQENNDWKVKEVFTNCNGLTVLEKNNN